MADSQRKTANLFIQKLTGVTIASTGEIVSDTNYDTYIAEVSDGETYTVSNVTGTQVFGFFTTEPTAGTITYNSSRTIFSTPSQTLTVPTGENIKYIGVRYNTGVSNAMLNLGSSPLPYEPYGWLHSLRKLTTATDTITTLPADVYADGQSATVGLVGNMVQNGTPSPSSIIMPSECGDKTGNLFNVNRQESTTFTTDEKYYIKGAVGNSTSVSPTVVTATVSNNTLSVTASGTGNGVGYIIDVNPNTTYTISFDTDITLDNKTYAVMNTLTENLQMGTMISLYSRTRTITTSADTKYLYIVFRVVNNTCVYSNIMLNTGETALPYEPYGVKIPILSASTTTPVYLGEVETTRKIKKLVFDGTENVSYNSRNDTRERWVVTIPTPNGTTTPENVICTHFNTVDNTSKPLAEGGICMRSTGIDVVVGGLYSDIGITSPSDSTTIVNAVKTYLQQQYANGTPVTVWYVLAEPTTAVVNEPLRKIDTYADEVSGITIQTITGKDSFDVETTLKPSEVSLTYTGWHDATVKERVNGQWE